MLTTFQSYKTGKAKEQTFFVSPCDTFDIVPLAKVSDVTNLSLWEEMPKGIEQWPYDGHLMNNMSHFALWMH